MKYRALTKAIVHLVVCAGLIGGSFLAVPHVALQAMAQTKPTQGTQHVAQADGNAPTMVILDALRVDAGSRRGRENPHGSRQGSTHRILERRP